MHLQENVELRGVLVLLKNMREQSIWQLRVVGCQWKLVIQLHFGNELVELVVEDPSAHELV